MGLVQRPLVMPCPYSKNYTTPNSKTPTGNQVNSDHKEPGQGLRTRNIPNLQAPVPETLIFGGVCGAYLQKKTHSATPVHEAETWLAFGLGRDLYQEDLQVLAHHL